MYITYICIIHDRKHQCIGHLKLLITEKITINMQIEYVRDYVKENMLKDYVISWINKVVTYICTNRFIE